LIKGVVAYTIEQSGIEITIQRATAGQIDTCQTSNWDTATEFLTEPKGEALHIVWNLQHFTKILFTLLCEHDTASTRIIKDGTKVFSVEKMLGLGKKKYLRGNIYEQCENNFYALQHWMPENDAPSDVLELANRAEKVLQALALLNIYPDKLTSPVGVFSQMLNPMPTLLSSKDDQMVDAANYCAPMMRKEWRETFRDGYFEVLHSYDIVSAYPYFISQLPDTNFCKIQHVTEYCPLTKNQWGIFKGVFIPEGFIKPIKNIGGCDYLTSDQLRWLDYWGGKFDFEDGYVLTFWGNQRPYYEVIQTLYNQRQQYKDNELATFLAKNIAQGISGKLDQVNEKGKLGNFCNPVYAAMVRSKTSLRLGHAINQWIKTTQINKDALINVNLDEVLFDSPVKGFIQPAYLRPGDWRYRVKEKAVVA